MSDTEQDMKQQLIRQALEARKRAYVPYSKYPVGAALLTGSGKIYNGTNIENAAYPVTICAERVAIFKAVSESDLDLRAIAVVTKNGGMPCGSCRQVMAEFNPDLRIYIADENGDITQETVLKDILPSYFGPKSLVRE
ncbi:MAG TPA: cytidine deaminase [Anaerolineaceae bacterium]|uniref:Cytidine deaminase n=1 Tax=Anaerolinea thermophila TaxID=167964 RepID=A0A117LGS4_9CHLR|nr:MAG: Cytidine deaminase [Anaerolinea thermophila]HAF62629.1 cytidine deaminase [Anaerolineaceae bacterium]